MNEETARLLHWAASLSDELGVDYEVDREAIHILLDLARDASHQVIRPAAPITAFLAGVAVGRGGTLGAVAATATQLALGHDVDGYDPDETPEPEDDDPA